MDHKKHHLPYSKKYKEILSKEYSNASDYIDNINQEKLDKLVYLEMIAESVLNSDSLNKKR